MISDLYSCRFHACIYRQIGNFPIYGGCPVKKILLVNFLKLCFLARNVYKRYRNQPIDTYDTTEMGRKVLVLKFVKNSQDRKRTFNARLRTLDRKIQELEIMTGFYMHMDVLKTATNISLKHTN